jgi:hypothetical protein
MSLLKVKVTYKSESKLCNYNKILKCTNIKFITISIIINVLFILIFYIKILLMMCVTMYSCMRKDIRIPIFILFI